MEEYYGSSSFYLYANDGWSITAVEENGSSEYLWSDEQYSGYTQNNGTVFTVHTAPKIAKQFTLNVDRSDKVIFYSKDNRYNSIPLNDGNNTITFYSADLPFKVENAKNLGGSQANLVSVKLNNKDVEPEYGRYVLNVDDGDVVDVVAYNPNAPKYTLTFDSSCNLAAISSIEVGNVDVADWHSGMEIEEGSDVRIYFDYSSNVSDVKINGATQQFYGSLYFTMDGNKTLSYTCAGGNTAYFNVTGPTEGVVITRGTSKWDTQINVSSSFSETFFGDSQNYCILAADGYEVTAISVTHNGTTSSKPIYGSDGTTVTLYDDDTVSITVSQKVDPRTATLTVIFDATNYNEAVSISNGGLYNKVQIFGTDVEEANYFKFNPNDNNEREFVIEHTVVPEDKLHSVKRGDDEVVPEEKPGSLTGTLKYVYTFSDVTDGERINIIGRDPSYVPTITEALIVFSDGCTMEAVDRVLINGNDIEKSVWSNPEGFTAYVGDSFSIYFKEGYTLDGETLSFADVDYVAYYGNGSAPLINTETGFFFTHIIAEEEDYAVINFTATAPVAQTYSDNVTFNVNIPAGVKITDTSASPATNVAVPSEQFAYTFTNEFNYVTIEAAEGYLLTNVNVNPHEFIEIDKEKIPVDAYDFAPADGTDPAAFKVDNFMVHDGYEITITVKEAQATPPAPEFGSLTVTVNGDPTAFTLENKDEDTVTLSAGNNTISLAYEKETFKITPAAGKTIESVTLDGVAQTANNKGNYSVTVTKDQTLVITTEGAATPAAAYFTINITGDISKVEGLFDPNTHTTTPLALGENTIELPSATGTYDFSLYTTQVLNSVKLNGTELKMMYGQYMFSAKNGDVLDVDTELAISSATISWNFVGCDASVLTGIRIGSDNDNKLTSDDEGFSAYLQPFTVDAATEIAYWLDTNNFNITEVRHNDDNQLTSEFHNFAVTGDTQITIVAHEKANFEYTLYLDHPERVRIYNGNPGFSPELTLNVVDGVATLSMDERFDSEFITVVPRYGYYLSYYSMSWQENGNFQNQSAYEPNADGNFVIYPKANCTISLAAYEVERNNTAVFFVDNLANFAYVSLGAGQFSVANSAEGTAVSGYTVFRFNDNDLGDDGLDLNLAAASDEIVPTIYINNEPVAFNADLGKVSGLMINDGDVIKVYSAVPQVRSLKFFTYAEPEKFEIKIDRILDHNPFTPEVSKALHAISRGTTQLHEGTEVTITPSAYTDEPWVKVDGVVTQLSPTQSHTFAVTGDHNVEVGEDWDTTSIESVIANNGTTTDIYNLQGVCVKTNADSSDIKALQPGLYIIGGKKVLVK